MRFSLLKKSASVALDFGNNNTLLTDYVNNCFSQPSFIVLNKVNKSVRAVGEEAYEMFGRTSEGLKVIKPLKGGVIADFDAASKLLKTLIKNAYPKRTSFDRFDHLICGVPYSTTEVERRALRDALEQFRSRKTYLIFEPIAAAIGMGLNVQEPDGKLVVDIGGGITEIALISLSGIVTYHSLDVAGDSFDEDIQNYCRKQYNLTISPRQAEQLKMNAGAATGILNDHQDNPKPFYVVGKDITTGIPKGITISHNEIADILNDSIKKIEEAILLTLDECPPELSGDIYTNGIFLTGGSSLLRGLKERLESKTKLPVHLDPNALSSVTKGISTAMRSASSYKAVLFK